MTLARLAFVVCLAGLLISLMVATVLLMQYAPGGSLIDVFLSLHPLLKTGAILLIVLALAGLTLAVLHRAWRRRDANLALILRILAGVSVAIGVLFAVFSWSSMRTAIGEVGPVSFSITSLTWVEIALMLALGFLPAVIALLGAAPVRVERRR